MQGLFRKRKSCANSNQAGYGIDDDKINYSRVEESAKIACIHESILQMENGYHTNLGERGSLISGGQRQRIGLARAIYRKNQILVLDESGEDTNSNVVKGLNYSVIARDDQ